MGKREGEKPGKRNRKATTNEKQTTNTHHTHTHARTHTHTKGWNTAIAQAHCHTIHKKGHRIHARTYNTHTHTHTQLFFFSNWLWLG